MIVNPSFGGGLNLFAGSVPLGSIIMWSGAIDQIPIGWHICDGTSGTPDLRGMFVIGAGGKYDVAATGGEETVKLTANQLAAHQHQQTVMFDGSRKGAGMGEGNVWSGNCNVTFASQANGHGSSLYTLNAGAGSPHNNMPPYYALAYIMKIAPDTTDLGADIYSEEETVIGTWIDGKPLYRRVFQGTTPPESTEDNILELPFIDRLVDQTVFVDGINGSTVFFPASIGYTYFHNASKAFGMGDLTHDLGNRPTTIALTYTKTTD